jgi:hypothetical protein
MEIRKADWSGIPTSVCPNCDCTWFNVPITFDQDTYEIAAYGLDGVTCWSCNQPITPPIPIDSRLEEIEEE